MKRLILFLALVICTVSVMGQTVQTTQNKKSEPKYEKVDAKTFKASSSRSSSLTYTPTGFYYQDRKGDRYEIYIHTITRGDNAGRKACYIKKIDKNGNPRYQKIGVKPEEMI